MVDIVGLRHRLQHRPSELSGGQQQRVAVARALASRPEIIFADEPTGNLDSRTGAEILTFMRAAVRDFGQTIVMVTHDPTAASYADRAVFLADGRIVDDLDRPDRRFRPRPHSSPRRLITMFTLALKELAARKRRLLSTVFAVLLGVAFMAGTMVFTDTIGATFDSVLAEADEGVDAYVRAPSEIDLGYGEPGPRLDASLATRVAAVDGVDQVALRINGYAQLVGRDGAPVGDVSASPAFGTNWVTVDDLNPYELASGHAPTNDDEIVVDKASADKAGYEPGDVAMVLTKHEPRQFTISGIARFGDDDSPAGATAVLFTDAVAAELLASPGEADAIAVTADPGVSQSDLATAVQAAVGSDVEVVTGATLVAENQAALAADIAGMGTIFRIFGFVAVFVAAFIINNTFAITVAQRTREMAMLRALGASGRQVRRSVLIEAVAVGSVASAAGLAAGIGVAAGLRGLMSVFGFDMPDGPTVISDERDGDLVRRRCRRDRAVGMAARPPCRTDRSDRRTARRQRRPFGRLGSPCHRRHCDHRRRRGIAARRTVRRADAGGDRRTDDLRRCVGARTGARTSARPGVRRAAAVAWAQWRARHQERDAQPQANRSHRVVADDRCRSGRVHHGVRRVGEDLGGRFAGDRVHRHAHRAGRCHRQLGRVEPRARRRRCAASAGVDAVAQARMSPAIVDGSATDTFYAFDATTIDELFSARVGRG